MTEAAAPPLHILVVDDEAMVRSAIGAYLGHIGFQVTSAGDGKEAIDLMAQNRGHIDMVITDIRMPVLDGISLIRHIRQSDSELPIVAISGDAQDDTISELDGLRAAFFNKPLDFRTFGRHLSTVLG